MTSRCKRWRYSNNAFGYVLSSNVARVWNNAFRFNALGGATGSQNTAIGDYAGFAVITGSNINAIGAELSGVSSFLARRIPPPISAQSSALQVPATWSPLAAKSTTGASCL